MWLNFNGPAPGGGTGSTQMSGAGIGTAGTSSQIAGGVVDSIFFSGDGDGGMATQDYRVYAPAAPSQYAWSSGVYAAGNNDAQVQNNRHPYYASVFAGKVLCRSTARTRNKRELPRMGHWAGRGATWKSPKLATR